MVVEIVDEAVGQIARGVVVDVDQRGDAVAVLACVLRCLLHSGAGEVADRFGAVLIAVLLDHAIQFDHEIVVEGDGDAVH